MTNRNDDWDTLLQQIESEQAEAMQEEEERYQEALNNCYTYGARAQDLTIIASALGVKWEPRT